MNNDSGNRQPEIIGHNVSSLLSRISEHISEQRLRDDLSRSLKLLTDLKFALDESSIVAVTDSRGIIQEVNDTFCRISQYSREELIGRDHRIINSGFHDKAFMRELWHTIRSGRIWRGDIKNRAKDGTYYWVNTTIVPFVDGDGKPYQYLAIRNEVTELKRVEEELQRMMTKVMHIQEEERKRLSRELHDGIGQSLYALLIQVDTLIGDSQRAELEKLRRNVSRIIEEVRDLAWELRPSVLDDLGVVPAIRTFIDNYSQHFGIRVSFESNLRQRLDVQTETTIYRIIQEALTNTGKYADVSEAGVKLTENDDTVEVRIADRGKGFDSRRRDMGVGLFSMEERARGIGGELIVGSEPGRGTTVTLIAPKWPKLSG